MPNLQVFQCIKVFAERPIEYKTNYRYGNFWNLFHFSAFCDVPSHALKAFHVWDMNTYQFKFGNAIKFSNGSTIFNRKLIYFKILQSIIQIRQRSYEVSHQISSFRRQRKTSPLIYFRWKYWLSQRYSKSVKITLKAS